MFLTLGSTLSPGLVSYQVVTPSIPGQPASVRSPSTAIGPAAFWMVRVVPGCGSAAAAGAAGPRPPNRPAKTIHGRLSLRVTIARDGGNEKRLLRIAHARPDRHRRG